MRTMAQQYVKQWKSLFFQLLWYILFPITICNMFSPDISKPNGCFNNNTLSKTCLKDLEDDTLLLNNLNFIFFSTIIALFIHLCFTTLIYLSDVKIFINEHDNSKFIAFFIFILAKNFFINNEKHNLGLF